MSADSSAIHSDELLSGSAPAVVRLTSRDNRALTRIIFWMTLPVFFEHILGLLVSTSDFLITGKFLAKEHLAAVCSSGYVVWGLQSVFTFVSVGATAMTARYIGGGLPEKANRAMHQAFNVGLGLTVLTLGIWFLFYPQIIAGLHLEGEASALAAKYLWIVLPTIPFVMITSVGTASLRGAGNMACGLWIMIAVNAVNILVSWSLATGIFGLPNLGFTGVALGTASGFIVGAVVTLVLVFRGSYSLKIRWRMFKPDWRIIRQLLWISIPAGIDMMTIIGCQLWFLGLINSLGVTASAVHGVALRVESWGFAPLNAFSMSATTLVGQFLGARKPEMAARSTFIIMGLAAVFSVCACSVYYFGAEITPYLFLKSNQTALAKACVPLLKLIAYCSPACVVMMTLSGALRGAGDTRVPMVISLIGFLFVRIVLTYVLAFDQFTVFGTTFQGLSMGVTGAWIGMTTDITVRGILLTFRFFQGGWKRIAIE
ncbi:MAG: MATE family efflux transporter [Thermoguttaceae bacterium]|nr:MATE family efflux transporter [Thermoguttaceae bacterium]